MAHDLKIGRDHCVESMKVKKERYLDEIKRFFFVKKIGFEIE
jgi:hypothetical protein